MDIEKDLTQTIDPDFLLKDTFYLQEIPTELFVYEDCITLLNHYNNITLDFGPELAFEIIYEN
jgi:hypothetical protein